MLLRFSIKNFLSFDEMVTFDMFPNPKRTMHSEHIYKDHTVPVLKQALVYGANASGKTNLIKAVYFVKQVINDLKFLGGLDMSDWMYKPNIGTGIPINFVVEFETAGQVYSYELSVYQNGSIDEILKFSGPKTNKKSALIYERKQHQFKTDLRFHKDLTNAVLNTLKVNQTSSLIAVLKTAPILSNKKLDEAINWLRHKMFTVGVGAEIPNLPVNMYEHKEMLEFTQRFLKHVDLGMTEFAVVKTDIDQWDVDSKRKEAIYEALDKAESGIISPVRHSGLPLFNIVRDEDKKASYLEFVFRHKMGDKLVELDIDSESDGTESILRLMPALYAAIHAECVVFVDEIEMSLHPLLIYEIIKLFANSKSNGQLIFTTHQAQLMNQQELIRPDEIWFTEKNKGATNLYSLNDFKEHATKSLQNGYLQGRYGAIPQLNLEDINDGQSYGD